MYKMHMWAFQNYTTFTKTKSKHNLGQCQYNDSILHKNTIFYLTVSSKSWFEWNWRCGQPFNRKSTKNKSEMIFLAFTFKINICLSSSVLTFLLKHILFLTHFFITHLLLKKETTIISKVFFFISIDNHSSAIEQMYNFSFL